MTAKEKIRALNESLRDMAQIGRQEHEPGTVAEDELLMKLAMLGCAMGHLFLEYSAVLADESTVTE